MGAPITLLYAGVLGLMLVFLSLQVLRYRVRSKVKGAEIAARMERVQGNFVEYVPFALLLLALNEMQGAPPAAIHVLGAGLVVVRLVHAYGLGYLGSRNYPRTLGALGTFLVLTILAMAAIVAAFGALRPAG